MRKKYETVFSSIFVIGLLVVSRLIPHMPNVTPLAAVALFSARYQSKLFVFIIPLAALFLSDIFIGFHSTMAFVYTSFVLNSIIGLLVRRLNFLQYIVVASIISSLQFFIITNLGVFMTTSLYEKSFRGIIDCYIAALPFFRNSLLGDLFYTGVLCSFYELCRTLSPKVSYMFYSLLRRTFVRLAK